MRQHSQKLIVHLLFFLFLSLPVVLSSTVHSDQRTIEGIVTKISKGNTIQVLTDNQTKLRVRLAGIDCPETSKISLKTGKVNKPGQPFADEAAIFTGRMVAGKRVKLVAYGPDRYQRILAFVFVGGVNVNLELVKAGLAEVYRVKGAVGAHRRELERAESEARIARRGMWAQGDKYESPAEYRKRMKIGGD